MIPGYISLLLKFVVMLAMTIQIPGLSLTSTSTMLILVYMIVTYTKKKLSLILDISLALPRFSSGSSSGTNELMAIFSYTLYISII